MTETSEAAAHVFEVWGATQFDKDGDHADVHELMQQVRQRKTGFELDKRPTNAEIKQEVRKMVNGKSGGEAKMPAEMWKAFEHDETTKQYIRNHVFTFWDKGRIQPQAIIKDSIIVPNPWQQVHFKDLGFDTVFKCTVSNYLSN